LASKIVKRTDSLSEEYLPVRHQVLLESLVDHLLFPHENYNHLGTRHNSGLI